MNATGESDAQGNPEPPPNDETMWKRFHAVREIHLSEQVLYWQRFVAFAALHAALLVVVSDKHVSELMIVQVFGSVLGVMWVYVQWASVQYARMYEDQFKCLCERAKLTRSRKFCKPPVRSSCVGVVVASLICALWIVSLCPPVGICVRRFMSE